MSGPIQEVQPPIRERAAALGGGLLPPWCAARVLAGLSRRAQLRRFAWSEGEVAWLYYAEARDLRVSILQKEEPCA